MAATGADCNDIGQTGGDIGLAEGIAAPGDDDAITPQAETMVGAGGDRDDVRSSNGNIRFAE